MSLACWFDGGTGCARLSDAQAANLDLQLELAAGKGKGEAVCTVSSRGAFVWLLTCWVTSTVGRTTKRTFVIDNWPFTCGVYAIIDTLPTNVWLSDCSALISDVSLWQTQIMPPYLRLHMYFHFSCFAPLPAALCRLKWVLINVWIFVHCCCFNKTLRNTSWAELNWTKLRRAASCRAINMNYAELHQFGN